MSADFLSYLKQMPLVAIIRGVRPEEAGAIGEALFDAGLRIIEVPLNSPDPLKSIEALAKKLGDKALIGAGTVLDPADVLKVAAAGGRLIVSPDTNPAVIGAAAGEGLVSLPGYFTPSEAFTAIRAGATGLKLFPAEGATPAILKAHRAVLPKDIPVLAVGGVTPGTMGRWIEAGANGFGLGSGLYKPGRTADHVGQQARLYVAAIRSRRP